MTMTGRILRMPEAEALGASLIGTDMHTGVDVFISQQAQQQGLIHLVGVSGSGKTTALHNLIHQGLRNGQGLAVIEPHGDLTRAIIATMPENRRLDVILLDLMDCGEFPFSHNVYECPDPHKVTEVAKTASQVFHIFEKAWGIGPQTPQLAMVLRHVTRTLIDNRATFAEIPLLLQDEAVRAAMVRNVTNPHTRVFWEAYNRKSGREKAEFTASTLNKVDAYLQEGIANILSQERSTIDFRRIMDEGKVLLVLLSPQLEEMSRLIGSVVVAGLLRAAFSRADTPEEQRQPFGLYVDEFQNFCTQDFATLIHEARKWRLSPVILSHQALGQLDEANRAAVAGASTRMVFRVSPEDAKAFAPGFDTTPTREIVGEEPVRAIVADPINHLVHKGHPHPAVARFTTQYLLPFEGLCEHMAHAYRPMIFGPTAIRKSQVTEARGLLSETLSACMHRSRADLFVDPLILFILGGAAGEGIPYVLAEHHKRSYWNLDEFNCFYPSANQFGEARFLENQKAVADLLHNHANKRVRTSKGERILLTPGPSLVNLLRLLRETLQVLANAPLMTDTGLFQPKYQLRTYADKEHEISNFLSTQPNYQAKVRLLSGEHVIRTNPSPQGISGDLFEARLTRIKRQMRFLGYVREARDVDEEVRKRHEQLRGRAGADDPPPTHD